MFDSKLPEMGKRYPVTHMATNVFNEKSVARVRRMLDQAVEAGRWMAGLPDNF